MNASTDFVKSVSHRCHTAESSLLDWWPKVDGIGFAVRVGHLNVFGEVNGCGLRVSYPSPCPLALRQAAESAVHYLMGGGE